LAFTYALAFLSLSLRLSHGQKFSIVIVNLVILGLVKGRSQTKTKAETKAKTKTRAETESRADISRPKTVVRQ
jgi:hypothetical protein